MSNLQVLKLTGIRNYAEPNMIEFGSKLTLICGENGSGKSVCWFNRIDNIRGSEDGFFREFPSNLR